MNKTWLAILAPFVLNACTGLTGRPNATFDQINRELAAATASKQKTPASSDADVVGRAMLPPLQLEAPLPPVAEPRFNLAVNNAPASQVFMALVSGTKYSMVFAPDLSGSITLNLKNVTVREALDTIRDLYGYEYKVQGNRILIQSNTMQTRMFQINYLSSRRQGTSDTRVTSSSPSMVSTSAATTGSGATGSTASNTPAGTPGSTGATTLRASDSSRVQTIVENDFWKELRSALDMIIGGDQGSNVIINPISGVILVKAMPSQIRAVEEYLKATQVTVERQVMLEAKIIEVGLNESFQTGINWAKFAGNNRRWTMGVLNPGATLQATGTIGALGTGAFGTEVAINPGKGGAIATSDLGKGFFGLAFQSANFASILSFLETQGNVQVLSSPRIATINNQKAVLKVGKDEFFVTGVSTTATTTTSGTIVTPNITVQPFFSGISLDVTPQIDEDGNIILHVHPAVTQVGETEKRLNLGSSLGGEYVLPLASSTINETDSIVRVQDGNIVAIGGLMSIDQSKNRDGLPGLSRAPGLGLLFGQANDSLSKRELVVLIKPTVIKNDSSWRQSAVDAQERVQALDPGTGLGSQRQ